MTYPQSLGSSHNLNTGLRSVAIGWDPASISMDARRGHDFLPIAPTREFWFPPWYYWGVPHSLRTEFQRCLGQKWNGGIGELQQGVFASSEWRIHKTFPEIKYLRVGAFFYCLHFLCQLDHSRIWGGLWSGGSTRLRKGMKTEDISKGVGGEELGAVHLLQQADGSEVLQEAGQKVSQLK